MNAINIQELRTEKQRLLGEVERLVNLKKQLYSNVDIETPMSLDEKDLNNRISNIYSNINGIVLKIRSAK